MRILRYLFLAFCIAEIASLVAMGSWIGVGWTMLLLLAASIAGGALIRKMGADMMAMAGWRSLEAHEIAAILPRAHLRLFAGILLIIPGFASDVLALIALLPPVQSFVSRKILAWLERHAPKPAGGVVIDGEVVEVDVARNATEALKQIDSQTSPPR